MIILNKNRLIYKAAAAFISVTMAASMTVTAGAWSENPGESEATTAQTSAPAATTTTTEWESQLWETTAATTTEEPDAVLEDDIVAEEDDEDIFEEDIEAEEEEEETEAAVEEPEETEAPATTTAAATAAPSNTAAPDSYQAVEPFKMYVPEVLNVRGGPGTDYDKLGQVYANNVISIIGTSGDWYVFDYYGVDGYLLSSLLQEVPDDFGQTTTTTTAPAETDATDPAEGEDGEGDASIEEEVTSTTEEYTAPAETDAPVDSTETTTKAPVAAGPVDEGDAGSAGGIPPVVLALIGAVAAFVLVGVLPVLVHRSHHKKLYQY
ncbi:MAG: SH3 domain-containing protein [Oscillospiraceae bacterium]|nr:SH3 domain-containing protein [Oscillospiraceae bacterium]